MSKPGLHSPCPLSAWEAAYLSFETPEEEIRKFIKRLRRLGAERLPRQAEVLELFCGRGNGLRALERLGFKRLQGVDLSISLLSHYHGPARILAGDCRHLPYPDRCKDAVVAQGGLHHLLSLPHDLEQTFGEVRRVLRTGGRVMFVEPWLTPFLTWVHWAAGKKVVRRYSPKMDAFQVMFEHERRTYEQWLRQPQLILKSARAHFSPSYESFAWGKWNFAGTPR